MPVNWCATSAQADTRASAVIDEPATPQLLDASRASAQLSIRIGSKWHCAAHGVATHCCYLSGRQRHGMSTRAA